MLSSKNILHIFFGIFVANNICLMVVVCEYDNYDYYDDMAEFAEPTRGVVAKTASPLASPLSLPASDAPAAAPSALDIYDVLGSIDTVVLSKEDTAINSVKKPAEVDKVSENAIQDEYVKETKMKQKQMSGDEDKGEEEEEEEEDDDDDDVEHKELEKTKDKTETEHDDKHMAEGPLSKTTTMSPTELTTKTSIDYEDSTQIELEVNTKQSTEKSHHEGTFGAPTDYPLQSDQPDPGVNVIMPSGNASFPSTTTTNKLKLISNGTTTSSTTEVPPKLITAPGWSCHFTAGASDCDITNDVNMDNKFVRHRPAFDPKHEYLMFNTSHLSDRFVGARLVTPYTSEEGCLSMEFVVVGDELRTISIVQQDKENRCLWLSRYNDVGGGSGGDARMRPEAVSLNIDLHQGPPRFFIEFNFHGDGMRRTVLAIAKIDFQPHQCPRSDDTNNCRPG